MKGNTKTDKRAELHPLPKGVELPTIAEARDLAVEIRKAVHHEAALTDPTGVKAQTMVIVAARGQHPTGEHPHSFWIELQDNMDQITADTVILSAFPQIVADMRLPFAERLELCRRIMQGEKPLADQARYTLSEYSRANTRVQKKSRWRK